MNLKWLNTISDYLDKQGIRLQKPIDITNSPNVTVCLSVFQTGSNEIAINLNKDDDWSVFFNHYGDVFTTFETKGKYAVASNFPVFEKPPLWNNFCFTLKIKNEFLLKKRMNGQFLGNIMEIEEISELDIEIKGATKISMCNVYSKALEEISCGVSQEGLIYTWNTSDWKTVDKPGQINTMLTAEICTNTVLFKFPFDRTFEEAVGICKRLNNSVMPEFHELAPSVFDFYGIGNGWREDIFLPNRKVDGGGFENAFTLSRSNLSEEFWKKANGLNGGMNEPILACKNNSCKDDKESETYSFICKLQNDMKLKVRGLCKNSRIDREYVLASKPTGNVSELTLVGQNSHIKYTTVDYWQLFVHNGRTSATSKVNKGSLLLGTNLWRIDKDPICNGSNSFDLNLSFNTCDWEEFNCQNGDCVDILNRCDGKFDCLDASDEKDCKIVHFSPNYNNNTGDVGTDNQTKVRVAVEIVSFLAINDKQGTIRAQIKVQMDWKDSRLNYLDLKEFASENKLDLAEADRIWKPTLHYFDTEIYNREQHKPVTITIRRNETDRPVFADSSFLYNALIYKGGHNTIQLKTWIRYLLTKTLRNTFLFYLLICFSMENFY